MEMKKIEINGQNYEIIVDNREAIDKDVLVEKITDYFDDYDYIVGDWAYGKLRLKGFYEDNNKKSSKINKISTLDNDSFTNFESPNKYKTIFTKFTKFNSRIIKNKLLLVFG